MRRSGGSVIFGFPNCRVTGVRWSHTVAREHGPGPGIAHCAAPAWHARRNGIAA